MASVDVPQPADFDRMEREADERAEQARREQQDQWRRQVLEEARKRASRASVPAREPAEQSKVASATPKGSSPEKGVQRGAAKQVKRRINSNPTRMERMRF